MTYIILEGRTRHLLSITYIAYARIARYILKLRLFGTLLAFMPISMGSLSAPKSDMTTRV